MNHLKRQVTFVLILSYLILPCADAQEGVWISGAETPADPLEVPAATEWISTFFTDAEPLELELSVDTERLLGQRKMEDPPYLSGVLRANISPSMYWQFRVRLKARGNSRRLACDFPPTKIDFSFKEVSYETARQLQEVKIVGLCRNNELYRTYLLREFLIYQLYEALTPYSFRTRLARLTVRDVHNESVQYKDYVFLLEGEDTFSQRFNTKEVEDERLAVISLDEEQFTLVALFQFMINNLDWGLGGLHNLKIFETTDSICLPVPFDFDQCTWVGAFYGDPDLPPPPVPPGRVFRGDCLPKDELTTVIGLYNENRDRLTQIIDTYPLLSPDNRAELLEELASFYRIINNPQQVEVYFRQRCE